jgi:hypothetical protein
VGKKVGRMLPEEASRGQTAGGAGEESTIDGVKKKYPWWMPSSHEVEMVEPSEKTEDTMSLFEGMNTRV